MGPDVSIGVLAAMWRDSPADREAEVDGVLADLKERGYVFSYEQAGKRRWGLTEKGWAAVFDVRSAGGSKPTV